jgi:DNA/RNA endonuclease G (NUC1)
MVPIKYCFQSLNSKATAFTDFMVSVDRLEALSGITFFSQIE